MAKKYVYSETEEAFSTNLNVIDIYINIDNYQDDLIPLKKIMGDLSYWQYGMTKWDFKKFDNLKSKNWNSDFLFTTSYKWYYQDNRVHKINKWWMIKQKGWAKWLYPDIRVKSIAVAQTTFILYKGPVYHQHLPKVNDVIKEIKSAFGKRNISIKKHHLRLVTGENYSRQNVLVRIYTNFITM